MPSDTFHTPIITYAASGAYTLTSMHREKHVSIFKFAWEHAIAWLRRNAM